MSARPPLYVSADLQGLDHGQSHPRKGFWRQYARASTGSGHTGGTPARNGPEIRARDREYLHKFTALAEGQ